MTDDKILVREGCLEDVDTIARFNAAMAEETEGLKLDEPCVRQGVRAVVEDASKGRYFLAEVGGDVAGQLMVTFEWSDWRNAVFLWIQSVYVSPPHRRRGVFRALYRHVEELASSPGHCGLRLYVHDGNSIARDVYERLGLVAPGYVVLETPDRLRDSRGVQ